METKNKELKNITLILVFAWMATAMAVIVGMLITKSPLCLLAFGFPMVTSGSLIEDFFNPTKKQD